MNKQYRKHQQRIGRIYLFLLLILVAVTGQAELSSAASTQLQAMPMNKDVMAQEHERQGSIYSCPMHPQEVSDQPGRCSICGMFLVAQTDAGAEAQPSAPMMEMAPGQSPQAMAHDNGHQGPIYICPMHPGEISDQPGRCGLCGMFLVEAKAGEAEAAMAPDTMQGAGHSMPAHAMDPSETAEQVMGDAAMEHARKHLDPSYVCPMHPQEVSDQPGRCSICGMFLVEAGAAAADPNMTEEPMEPMEPMGHSPASHAAGPSEAAEQAMAETAMEHALKHQDPTYICPMHPQIMSDSPSSCPICGMDLVAKTFEPPSSTLPAVTLSPAVVQNMGVRSARAAKGRLRKTIHTQGRVAYDDDRIIQVHPRTPGWIENLYVRTDGVRIERKDDLADYFSPDVLWAQQDYISALEDSEVDSFGSSTPDPARAFRERSGFDLLKYFKVPSMDIMGLETSMQPRSIIPIRAPQGGVLIEHNVREGAFVTPADNIFTIVDLSEVWVMVDIFEHQLAWIRPGLPAEISTPAYPGRSWTGKLDFVYPEVDPKARTMRARVEVNNPGELLMPNMFVQVDLSANTQKQAVLMVPREAVIITGEREVVVKALGSGRFQPVEVTSGLWNDGHAEILSGLQEGDEVVVSGQFLIDSESSLKASFRRLSE